jgi:hypothetical protein
VDVFLLIGIVVGQLRWRFPLRVFLLLVLLLFLYLSDFAVNLRITCESFVTVIESFLRPFLLMKYGYKTRSRKKICSRSAAAWKVSPSGHLRTGSWEIEQADAKEAFL